MGSLFAFNFDEIALLASDLHPEEKTIQPYGKLGCSRFNLHARARNHFVGHAPSVTELDAGIDELIDGDGGLDHSDAANSNSAVTLCA